MSLWCKPCRSRRNPKHKQDMQYSSPTTWRESGQTRSVWTEVPTVHPLTGQELWECHAEPRDPPGLSEECQTERPGWPGCSSAAERSTPSDVLLVVLSSRSEEAWFNVSACRNTLDMQSGQHNPSPIQTPNTTFQVHLMNASINSPLRGEELSPWLKMWLSTEK